MSELALNSSNQAAITGQRCIFKNIFGKNRIIYPAAFVLVWSVILLSLRNDDQRVCGQS
jgi:hypothetical protein